jgi:predicted cupin superfamily sugar epimerase
MGTNIQAGEVLQLFVPGGWWKASEIPPEDVESVKKGEADPESVGCLITEVVVPGWTPDQHGFLTLGKVRQSHQPFNPDDGGWQIDWKILYPAAQGDVAR